MDQLLYGRGYKNMLAALLPDQCRMKDTMTSEESDIYDRMAKALTNIEQWLEAKARLFKLLHTQEAADARKEGA